MPSSASRVARRHLHAGRPSLSDWKSEQSQTTMYLMDLPGGGEARLMYVSGTGWQLHAPNHNPQKLRDKYLSDRALSAKGEAINHLMVWGLLDSGRLAGQTKTAGFFSYECMACGKSLLSDMAARGHDFAWMSDVVVIPKNPEHPSEAVLMGEYDGYGRVGDNDVELQDYEYGGGGFSAWHKKCWEKVGRPRQFRGQAPNAGDQGWFFEDSEYEGIRPGR